MVEPGYLVAAQESPADAVASADFGRYACVLVDEQMGRPAIELVERWSVDGDPRTPICLIVWAGVGDSQIRRATRRSVDAVLMTDLDSSYLSAQILRVIEFRRMRRALFDLEKMALIGHVSAGVLHELKNPLNNLLGGMDRLLAQVSADPAVLRWGGLMRRNGELLRDSLRDLLGGFSSHDSQDSVELHSILDRALAYVLKGDPVFRVISVERDWSDDSPIVVGSAGHLLHLFLNLILNARQAMGSQQGRLIVRTRWEGDVAAIDVEDDGPGISPRILPKLFLHPETTKAGGSGIGLVFCRKIVDRHYGTISAENRTEGGARFTVRLPASRSNDAEPRLAP
jgi:signal transduction histidine kinase